MIHGEPKILDWNLSRSRDSSVELTCGQAIGGSLAQFSRPEFGLSEIGLSGIRGGTLGTGRLQHRYIINRNIQINHKTNYI